MLEGRSPWLSFDPEKGMSCTICVEEGVPEPNSTHNFIKGSYNFRFSAISDHEKSSSHVKSSRIKQSRIDAASKNSVAHNTVLMMNQSIRAQMEHKFRNVHALVKHNRPLSDYQWLTELDAAKGLNTGTSYTYSNRFAATTFLECISDTLSDELVQTFDDVNYFSLTVDGSTDSSTTEQETIFIRYCLKGKIYFHFLCIGEPRSTGSLDLYNFVQKKIMECKLETHIKKLIGFGCDGAANMLGSKSRLVKRLKADCPELMGVHCLAHRLELAYRDSVKKDSIYTQLSSLLIGLYYFFKNSPKQRKNLRECMEVLAVKGTLPHRISGSRWLPHMKRALDTLFRTFPVFVTHLQDASNSNPKANGPAIFIQSQNIITYVALLQEIINPLARLSLTLQKPDLTLGDAKAAICATKTVLEDKSTKLQNINTEKQLLGYNLKSIGKQFNVKSKSQEILKNILSNMDKRYADLCDGAIEATTIGCLRNWPSSYSADYGVSEIRSLVERFRGTLEACGVDLEDIEGEWNQLMSLVYSKFGENFRGICWRDIHATFSENGVQNALSMMDLIHSLPPTSVANEACFNQMKLIKTDRRQALTERHLNDLMVVKLRSPSISEFDPQPSVDKWMLLPTKKGNRRRYTYQREKKATADCEENACETIVIDDEVHTDEVQTETDKEIEGQSEKVLESVSMTERVSESDEVRESDSESDCGYEQDEDENEQRLREIVMEIEVEREYQ